MTRLRSPGQAAAIAGFTLVEVLVALVIMAILAGMAWQGVDRIAQTRSASEQRLQHSLRLNTVVAQWEQDLAALQETGVVPALGFDGGRLRLTRSVDGGMQVVVWALVPRSSLGGAAVEEGRTDNVWLRWAGPPTTRQAGLQDSWIASQQLLGNEPEQLRLFEGITQWQVYFYRGNAWTNAQSSGNSAPGTTFVPTRVVPPTGVRLVLEFGPDQPRQGQLTRDVALGPQAS